MDRSLNKVMVIGWVGNEPEIRYSPTGKAVASFSVYTTHQWQAPDGQTRSNQEWFNVVAWGHVAELSHDNLSKGSHLYLEGRLQTRSWEDGDGKMLFRTEVVAQKILPLSENE